MGPGLLNLFTPKVITDRAIDSAYIDGYVSDSDYRSYYMDPARSFIPSWISPNTELSDIHAKCAREDIVKRKNAKLHDINMATNILGL